MVDINDFVMIYKQLEAAVTQTATHNLQPSYKWNGWVLQKFNLTAASVKTKTVNGGLTFAMWPVMLLKVNANVAA